MEKNEIVINGVHHVLVKYEKKGVKCQICSLSKVCRTALLCVSLFCEVSSLFEIKEKKLMDEEFDTVVKVMDLLRRGKISTLTPNCDVREKILLAEKNRV